MSRISRLVPAAALAFATVALPFVTAGSAQAKTDDCMGYLKEKGYYTDYRHFQACQKGEFGYYYECVNDLLGAGVWEPHAHKACDLAERD